MTALTWAGRVAGQDPQFPRAKLGAPIDIVVPSAPAHPEGEKAVGGAPIRDVLELPAVVPAEDRPLSINLATALHLAGIHPLDIALATQRLEAASAALQRANVLWLPTVYFGADYFRHDGRLQDVGGMVFTTSKSTLMVGAGPSVVFAVTDAIYGPLAARQVVAAQREGVQAARNDTLLSVAEAYFHVQQARGEVAGARDVVRRTEEVAKRIEALIEGLSPALEKNRVMTELARRRQTLESALERWQIAGAELNRLLRLDAAALVEPMEPPHLRVDLIDLNQPADALIVQAIASRPELQAQQALVQAAGARVRQERVRPFVPSVLIRGAGTNPAGTLSSGYFGGGFNDDLSNFNGRNSVDVQLLWEIQNLGFGNQALVRAREAENQQAMIGLLRAQDLVASEVVQALAQATRAVKRVHQAEDGLKNALTTAEKSLEGMKETRNVGGALVLVFRPLEVVAAMQSLDQAYRDYYTATADANRAQFRLYRAIGRPAQTIATDFSGQGSEFVVPKQGS